MNLEVGTLITCPECRTEIAKVTKTIHRGELLKLDSFEFLISVPKQGAPMHCPNCGESYGRRNTLIMQIHTSEGWR